MTPIFSDRGRLSRGVGGVLALLAIAVFLNFVDRGNLSIAAPLLKDELHLSPSQLGILFSPFFWTYTFCQIPAGWIVDSFVVYWVLALGFFLWSSATPSLGSYGFAALLVIRLILGIGESVAYPSCWKILVFRDLRGFASAIIQARQASNRLRFATALADCRAKSQPHEIRKLSEESKRFVGSFLLGRLRHLDSRRVSLPRYVLHGHFPPGKRGDSAVPERAAGPAEWGPSHAAIRWKAHQR